MNGASNIYHALRLLGHYGRWGRKRCMILRIERRSVKCSSGHDMAIEVTKPQQNKIKSVKIPTRIRELLVRPHQWLRSYRHLMADG